MLPDIDGVETGMPGCLSVASRDDCRAAQAPGGGARYVAGSDLRDRLVRDAENDRAGTLAEIDALRAAQPPQPPDSTALVRARRNGERDEDWWLSSTPAAR
ncbi:hypothetical protein GCM10011504_45610 [Siccirubricoccus deserti]|nr:hypothetical protein GCM10011504_45610 [Siccirubricoccus deserti]